MNLTLLEAALWLTALTCSWIICWWWGYSSHTSDQQKKWRENKELRTLARTDNAFQLNSRDNH